MVCFPPVPNEIDPRDTKILYQKMQSCYTKRCKDATRKDVIFAAHALRDVGISSAISPTTEYRRGSVFPLDEEALDALLVAGLLGPIA
jgi:hypothetical protein